MNVTPFTATGWIVGLTDCWIDGLLDCRIVGLSDCRIVMGPIPRPPLVASPVGDLPNSYGLCTCMVVVAHVRMQCG